MDVYFEQNIANPNIDKHKTRTRVLTVIRYVCIIALVIIIPIMIGQINVGLGAAVIIWNIVYILLFAAPLVLAFIFLGRIIARTNMEYDYLLNGNMFRIVKVVNRKKRKLLLEAQVSGFESLGHIDSEAYDRYAANREVKKQFAVVDYQDEAAIYYIYYNKDGTHYLLHFTPNQEMIISLRKSVGRINILDKSFKVREAGDGSVLG